MYNNDQKFEHDEQEIYMVKEWLSSISKEQRAGIKGALTALLSVQENQGLPSNSGVSNYKNLDQVIVQY